MVYHFSAAQRIVSENFKLISIAPKAWKRLTMEKGAYDSRIVTEDGLNAFDEAMKMYEVSATGPESDFGMSSFDILPSPLTIVNNSSNSEVRDVVIKAEIQTERQRLTLLDTSKAPVESIRAGGRYDFIVEHDVKELGAHTLVCNALYVDGDGQHKYLPQFFKFIVANPLSVRS